MIIIKLTGGLGNQLFQYVFGLKWAKENNTILKIDLSWFEQSNDSNNKRPYVLNFFNLELIEANYNDISALSIPLSQSDRFPAKIWNKIIQTFHPRYIKQKNIVDLYEDRKIPNNSYLVGSWISKKHCSDMHTLLQKIFQVKQKYIVQHIIYEHIQSVTSVAVHIRRGDYLTTGNFLLTIKYFYRAIKFMQKSVSGNLHYFIFSDDIPWCKAQLAGFINKEQLQFTFIDEKIPSGEHDIYHFYLMKSCKHFIISNSTFSWWAAWLAEYENKIVVCPRQFEYQNIQHKHLVLSDWKTINNTN